MNAEENFRGDPVSYRFDIDRDLLCMADGEGRFTSLNGAWEVLLGWSREELMARPFIDFVHPEDAAETAAISARIGEQDVEVVDFENRYRTKDGDWRRLRWYARSDGQIWFAVAFDVTEVRERRARMEQMLAVDRFIAYSQPISEIGRARPLRSELLIRLEPSNGGDSPILPEEFVPEAERLGLIGTVDRWMLSQALPLAVAGRPVQVNISQETLRDEALADELIAMVREAGIPTGNLIFELTETAAVESMAAAKDFSERASALGCLFAIDDWGTGYGSLNLLRELKFSFLKIDASFVQGALRSEGDQALLRGVIAFAERMRLRTVGEGVETREMLEMLDGYGVDEVQGYLIGRPAPLVAA